MYENEYEYAGEKPGKTSIILAGVHGDEIAGVKCFETLKETLCIQSGKVILAYGNPRGIELNLRFTEANLNRMFKPDELLTSKEKQSYEYMRAQELKPLLLSADALLDLHTSSTPQSEPFLIAEENARAITKKLPADIVVGGFDKEEPGGTDYFMNREGRIGICAECGYDFDPSAPKVMRTMVEAFLRAQGHLEGEQEVKEQRQLRVTSLYYTRTDSFILTKTFEDFESVTKGTSIGKDGENSVFAEENGFVLFARNREEVGAEAFLFGREE